jgi:predicted GIY-YIG superfamily endonuclease
MNSRDPRKREREFAVANSSRGVAARLGENVTHANATSSGGGAPTKSMPLFVYVLQLEGGNFYVGKSVDVMKRYQQHLNSFGGSAWTRKYKPIGIDKIQPSSSDFDEDKITKEYMSIFGIDKVRGGAYVEVQLSSNQIDLLLRELRSANDLCTRCGGADHFVKDCHVQLLSPNKTELPKTELRNASNHCTRCGRVGHMVKDCYAHLSPNKTDLPKTEQQKTSNHCSRCGRAGHYAKDCYAKTDVSGGKMAHEDFYDESDEEEWVCNYCDRSFTTAFGAGVHERSCKEKISKDKQSKSRGGGGASGGNRC